MGELDYAPDNPQTVQMVCCLVSYNRTGVVWSPTIALAWMALMALSAAVVTMVSLGIKDAWRENNEIRKIRELEKRDF